MPEGDLEFFRTLYETHQHALLRFAARQVGGNISEDLVEETFLIAWCKIEILMTHPRPKYWLFRTLLNRCKREVARKSYQMEIATDMDTLYIPVDMEAPNLLELLPTNLSKSDTKVLLLRFRDKIEFVEIAELLGIKEDAARKRVSRAVARCRNLLIESSNQKSKK